MVWIPGSNNGTFGAGMARGAVFPADPGYFYQGFPLPNMIQHPTGVMDKPYQGRSFGTVYQLTPGGVTTEAGWGFTNKGKYFGKSRNKRRSKRLSRSRHGSKMHRCEGVKENGKRCKHKTSGQYCKHHLKQARRSVRKSIRRRRSRR